MQDPQAFEQLMYMMSQQMQRWFDWWKSKVKEQKNDHKILVLFTINFF